MKSLDEIVGAYRQDMKNALRTLVQIPSVRGASLSGAPFGQPAADALHAFLRIAEPLGLRTENFDNTIGTAEWGENPALGILCHLDVVPAGTGWTFPPFDLTERDGWLYGRGVIDDKGPTVAALFALRAVLDSGIPLRGVRLIAGCAEETGQEDIDYYKERASFPPMVFTPDSDFPVIHIEKGRVCATLTAKWAPFDGAAVTAVTADGAVNAVPEVAAATVRGLTAEAVQAATARFAAVDSSLRLAAEPCDGGVRITAHGRAAHASLPESGCNALTGLTAFLLTLPLPASPALQALSALAALFPHGETDGTAAGIACREAESGALTLAWSRLILTETGAAAQADIRFPLGQTKQGIIDKLTETAGRHGLTVAATGVEPHHVPADSPFVQTLLQVYEDVTGQAGRPLAVGGGTYVHDIPGGVAFGAEFPGDDNRMHGADERWSEERMMQTARIYAHAIARLCGENA